MNTTFSQSIYGIPVIHSSFLEPDAIIPLPTSMFTGKCLMVGDMMYEFLTTTDDISTKAWCWFKAKYYGYGRPKVSIA